MLKYIELDHVESYLYDGKEILVLAEGRLVNLAAATGHPASVMDMSLLTRPGCRMDKDNHEDLEPKVLYLPNEVDLKIAATKLGLMGGELEILTKEQIEYLGSGSMAQANLSIFKKVLSVGSGKLAQELDKKVDSINSKESQVEKYSDDEIKNKFQNLKSEITSDNKFDFEVDAFS